MPGPANTRHKDHLRHPRLVDVVASLLKDSGMTQREMIARWSVGKSFIGDLTSGTANPSADAMQRIYEDLTGRPLLGEK